MRVDQHFAKRSAPDFPQFSRQNGHFLTHQNGKIDPGLGERAGQRSVEGRAMAAQLLHRAKHGNAAPGRGAAQLRQSGAHRSGIGVVTFIDQQRRAVVHRDLGARAASGKSGHFRKRKAR